MRDATVSLNEDGWILHLHCAVTCYHTDKIIWELLCLGCSDENVRKADKLMRSCRLNTGLTFSNSSKRETVMVVALTSSAAEFQNSLQHEIRHMVDHICDTDDIRDSEEVAYLTGRINLAVFPRVRELLCEHCRGKVAPFKKK